MPINFSHPLQVILVKVVFLMLVFMLVFLYYIEDYFIDESAEIQNNRKSVSTEQYSSLTPLSSFDDDEFFEGEEITLVHAPAMMDLHAIPPFDMGFDDILINQVNNKSPKTCINLASILAPEETDEVIEPELTPDGKPKYSIAQMNLNKPTPFTSSQAELLINEVNNTDEIDEIDVNLIFTKPFIKKAFHFLFVGLERKNQLPQRKFFPRGYAMSPYDPPPFNVGTADVLFNEVNNRDVRDDIDICEFLGTKPMKFFRVFRAQKSNSNKKVLPSDNQ